mgnify:CR=1 FL=1
MMTEHDNSFFLGLVNQLCKDYAFHRDVASKIAMKAWNDLHDGGYSEVTDHAHELSEFVEGILWLEMSHAGNHNFDESKYEGSKSYKSYSED